MMKKILLLVFCWLSVFAISKAQIYLQLEKYGTTKVKRFEVGDKIHFQLKGKEQNFRSEYIEQILLDEKIVVFSEGMANLEDIAALRSFQYTKMGKSIGNSLYIFGGSWIGFSMVDWAYGNQPDWGTAIVPATAFLSGWLIKQIFRHRTYKIGKRRRLRLLDLRVW